MPMTRVCVTTASGVLAVGFAPAMPAIGQMVSVEPSNPTAYQAVTLDLTSTLTLDELDASPNPFLDYRFDVSLLSPSGAEHRVPGYFDGDGNGNGTGSVFRVRFSPTEHGAWQYEVSFREGVDVAIDLSPTAGSAINGDGLSGTFVVAEADESAAGFGAKGRLDYVGEHYLQFANGEYYIKGGVDSPENWLGYTGFDNTEDDGGLGPSTPDGLHGFANHVNDWNAGDPDWDSPDSPGANDGRAIIGALNYLASTGVNSVYFLPMNIGGDGRDTWPFASTSINGNGSASNNNLNYDISKLAQWTIVFNHAQTKGLLLHFVLNEAEARNKRELDGYDNNGNQIAPALGVERKLFYREMVARFGYLNAKQWNICEEYNHLLDIGAGAVIEWAEYIDALDPWETPTTVHSFGNISNPNAGPWQPFIGEQQIDLTSLQHARVVSGWGDVVESYRIASAAAGRPIPVMVDEPGSPTRDLDSPGDFDEFRKRLIWPILMSGGGAEWFIHNRDQAIEDFREFDQLWRDTGAAVRFFEENLPFWDMTPRDGLLTGASSTFDGAEVFAGDAFSASPVLAIYYTNASNTGTIDLSAYSGNMLVEWFNPRTYVFSGSQSMITAGTQVSLPAAPSDPGEDWVMLITSSGLADCNINGIPDLDEIADGSAADCDKNGVPDACQADCNSNGIADACEPDSDGDGIIDACDADCNNNFIADTEELSAGGGLAANYFPSLDFTGTPLARIDGTVDFSWGSTGPGQGILGSMFTSRWTGHVKTGSTGVYRFFPTVNDGVRLWIDGQLIVDEYRQQAATEFEGSIALPADTWVSLRMEHFQEGGTAVAQLRWITPGGTKAIVPATALAPSLDANSNGVPDACDPACPTDLNGTGATDIEDLLLVLREFERSGDGDTDGDNDTDIEDLLAVLREFGPC